MERLSVEFDDNANRLLSGLARAEGVEEISLLQRALVLYDYLSRQEANGNKVAILDRHGKVEQIVKIRSDPREDKKTGSKQVQTSRPARRRR